MEIRKKSVLMLCALVLLFSATFGLATVFAGSSLKLESSSYAVKKGDDFEVKVLYEGAFNAIDLHLEYDKSKVDVDNKKIASGIDGAICNNDQATSAVYMNASSATKKLSAKNGKMLTVTFTTKETGNPGIRLVMDTFVELDASYDSHDIVYTLDDQIKAHGGIDIKVQKELSKIEIKNQPTKDYFVGDAFKADGSILLTYNDQTTEEKSMTDDGVSVSGYDMSKAGSQTVTVAYGGKECTYDINVKVPAVTGIKIKTKPSKLNYIEGKASDQTLDLTGGMLTVEYDDASTVEVSMRDKDVSVSGYDNYVPGDQTITVMYSGFSDSYQITVEAQKATGITVTAPTKTNYLQNSEDGLDLTGGKVVLHYNNDNTESFDLNSEYVTVGEMDTSILGKQEIPVTFNNGVDQFDGSFTIEIVEKIDPDEPVNPEKPENNNQNNNQSDHQNSKTASVATGIENNGFGLLSVFALFVLAVALLLGFKKLQSRR